MMYLRRLQIPLLQRLNNSMCFCTLHLYHVGEGKGHVGERNGHICYMIKVQHALTYTTIPIAVAMVALC
jgi:hypothetical protein